MFNKREASDTAGQAPSRASGSRPASAAGNAVIGASIKVDGTIRGEEDLLIEGRVDGTVELKQNSVTIGSRGQVKADVHAHTIFVEGRMEGNLVASERVVIRQSADIKGSITAPRISLEDGARFNGTIDMDPQTETLKQVFGSGGPARQAAGKSGESAS
ncbi:bactofilin family protein [Wenzhouxiangella marina]|uniref:Putative acyltransferase n=1 Tax=Wenzhouxiangella marina TaxID=1579979 RepID=A0A0K0XSC2_9GAMM|nr:polymer-forming cytoskeletal protein [Wenzhouxiangella marina]AKS40583.1 Putative acyltransferase [Wenzhouxiangella marina]MBB6088351.1 cytoskeletal protein CcmA (bactofilin family) [Wenzhouxiangella marina]